MATTKWGVSQSSISHSANKQLFVEGAFDFEVLSTVLRRPSITVVQLNGSRVIKSAADAFKKVAPGYYFIIDRDHLPNEQVNKYWNDFMKGKSNIISWRKKEIENYFLEPKLLARSKYISAGTTPAKIKEAITKFADSRKYYFAANRVILQIKSKFYNKNITDIGAFIPEYESLESTLQRLHNFNDFDKQIKTIKDAQAKIDDLFEHEVGTYTSGSPKLSWTKGEWRDLMPGKEILNHLICNSGCFRQTCRDEGGNENLVTRIIRELLLEDPGAAPDDFIAVRDFFAS